MSIFKDNPDETMFMKRLVNQESLFGKAKALMKFQEKWDKEEVMELAQVDEVALAQLKINYLILKVVLVIY